MQNVMKKLSPRSLAWLSLAASLAVTTSLPALAADRAGNGGDAVVCVDAEGKRHAELLDYYETRVQRVGMELDLGAPELDYRQKIEFAMNRLGKVLPEAAAYFRTQAQEFEKNTVFSSSIELVDIPDSENIVLPRGCGIEQVAIQKKPDFAEDRYFIVNRDLWDAMDSTSKAGLVLHEVIYRLALQSFAKDSKNTRYFNSLVASPKIETLSASDFFSSPGHTGILEQVFKSRAGLFKPLTRGYTYQIIRSNGRAPLKVWVDGEFEKLYASGTTANGFGSFYSAKPVRIDCSEGGELFFKGKGAKEAWARASVYDGNGRLLARDYQDWRHVSESLFLSVTYSAIASLRVQDLCNLP